MSDGHDEHEDHEDHEEHEEPTASRTASGTLASLRAWNQRRLDAHPHHAIRKAHPKFLDAVIEDARVAASFRNEHAKFTSRGDGLRTALRLAIVSDAFGAHMLYRAKARLQALGIPGLPRVAHRLAMATAQICVGDPVIMEPGVYFPHGQVVIDGVTVVESGVAIRPWVTIGLKEGDFNGPTIERNVQIGTGAKVVGPVRIGRGALIGANAVVVSDVPAGATAVGVPARVLDRDR